MDHGRVAAGGFLYQYWRTAEAILIALTRDDRIYACRVEGAPHPDELGAIDIVDFDLIDAEEKVLRCVQVKSGGPGTRLTAGQVFTILAGMVGRVEAGEYVLLTNTGISPKVTELVQLLASGLTRERLRPELSRLLRGAAVAERLSDLTDEDVRGLQRCRVSVDSRSQTELRDALLDGVRSVRAKDGRGIGTQSSGLLLAYLHSEIHRRAASPEDAAWTMSSIREALYLDNHALAGALGERDWGGVLGLLAPIPDVPRKELLSTVVGVLDPFRPTGRTIGRCVLTGLSGIGKSSLASWYVAEYLDAYDMVFWVDASGPPVSPVAGSPSASLVEDFRAVARRLGIAPDVSAEQLRIAVHERLTRLDGRWLIVFDDCGAASISSWIPQIGDGDVLMTSIDSTFPLKLARSVPVGGMTPAEAVQLLAARLGLTEEQAITGAELVRGLAADLDYWPLALELAAGYMLSCMYTVSDIPHYLETLKLRSLDDHDSIPAGYPATLIAAINMASERLAVPGNDQKLIGLTASMVMGAAYLSARQIPIHLLAAATMTDPRTLPEYSGPVIAQNPLVHEAVRSLRRVSFVRFDQPLPRQDGDPATQEHAISMNSVLQEVMRARTENQPDFQDWQENLKRLAAHLDHWLKSAVRNEEAEKVRLLVPHCNTLVYHLARISLADNRIALLIGNLGAVYTATHDFDTGIALMRAGLQILIDSPETDEYLICQTRLQLAGVLTADEQNGIARAAEAVENLKNIVAYSQRLASDPSTQDTASRICSHALDILRRLRKAGYAHRASLPLTDIFSDILVRLPSTWDTEAREAILQAEGFMSAGQLYRAERTYRPFVTPLRNGSGLQLQLHVLLLGTLTAQGKWNETRIELDDLTSRLGENPILRDTAEAALNNAGFYVAMAALHGDQAARDLFSYLMEIPCFASVRRTPSPSFQEKFRVLELALSVVRESRADWFRYANEVYESIKNDSAVFRSNSWLFLVHEAARVAEDELHWT